LNRRFAGSNPDDENEFLTEIKIHSMPSFGGEVKPSAPCLNGMLKKPAKYKDILRKAKLIIFFARSSPLLLDHCWYDLQKATLDEYRVFLYRYYSTMVIYQGWPTGPASGAVF
jgi:hypothetical protein